MTSPEFTTDAAAMSNHWGVFSAVEGRPINRGLTTSKEDADKMLAEIKAEDAASERGEEDEYYVVRLSKADLAGYLPQPAPADE